MPPGLKVLEAQILTITVGRVERLFSIRYIPQFQKRPLFLKKTKIPQKRPFHIDNQLWIIKLFTFVFHSGLLFLVCTTIPGNKYYNPRPQFLTLVDNIQIIYYYRILWYYIPITVFPGKIWIIIGPLGIVTSSKTKKKSYLKFFMHLNWLPII